MTSIIDQPVEKRQLGRADRPRTRSSASASLWILGTAALAAVVMVPILLYFARVFEPGTLDRVMDVPDLGRTLGMTVFLAAGSTVIGAVLAVALAAAVARIPGRLQSFAAIIPQLPLVVPPVAMVYGWIFVFSPTVGYGNSLLRMTPFFDHLSEGPIDVYSVPAIMVITSLDLAGFIYAFVLARIFEINGSVTASARVCGASAFQTFMTVTFPLLRPSLVAGVVVAFLIGLGQFTAPLFLGTRANVNVIATEIFRLREQYPIDYAVTAALGLPLLAFGIVSIVLQRKIVGDQRRYITSSSGRGISTQNGRWPFVTTATYGFVTVIVPIAAIALVALSPFWNGDLSAITFTTVHVRDAFGDPKVWDAILNTLRTSFIAAAIVLPIGFVAAIALSGVLRAPRAVRATLDFIFIAPLAVPRALLGMAILFVFIQQPFSLYGSVTLFVIGYAFIILPFSLRSQYNSLIGVDSSLFEAARVCGAGQLRMVRSVALPVARRGMAAALGLAFVLLSNDFAVSVMVRTPGNQVLGTLLYERSVQGLVPDVAVLALIMTVITTLVLLLTIRIGGKSSLKGL
ncbi:iron ABC transporter permease [Rhodococcus sp. 06-156-3C]|uniref:ABC transporter permease n=1 Tax=Nocardiaceae TaxID=85025 RepID=UPI00068E3CFF|nr:MULTISPECIES: iron ABC transporter permease [Rhodococcus]OZD11652.1 iron ABC transporter permease [Rhodococcus sp. 06-156-4C]OZD15495.1 iron ABC transporter permease [Rhodococcus sp. 06-156-4a]OZD23661.1 iron ABC transporter permease [Rhodococcus sp. 06-156-3C]OZD27267.1 iron ABC transporter permease [Rhodococcus sp. 06-156-3b]OZD31337.1 iron ABC transporter permease [Rhodococcus sp. 06-156-3]